jgi:hypothetical protein
MIMNVPVILSSCRGGLAFFRDAFSRYAGALQHDRVDAAGVTIIRRFSSVLSPASRKKKDGQT